MPIGFGLRSPKDSTWVRSCRWSLALGILVGTAYQLTRKGRKLLQQNFQAKGEVERVPKQAQSRSVLTKKRGRGEP
jgi:hypothetical protein